MALDIESTRNSLIAIDAIGRSSKRLKRWVVISSGETRGHGEDCVVEVCYRNKRGWVKLEQIVSLTPQSAAKIKIEEGSIAISDAAFTRSSGLSTSSLCEDDDSSITSSSSSKLQRSGSNLSSSRSAVKCDFLNLQSTFELQSEEESIAISDVTSTRSSGRSMPLLREDDDSSSSTSSSSGCNLDLKELNISNIKSTETLNDSACIVGSTLSISGTSAEHSCHLMGNISESYDHNVKSEGFEQVQGTCYERGVAIEIIALGKTSRELKRWTVMSTGVTRCCDDGVNELIVTYRNAVYAWVPLEQIVGEVAHSLSSDNDDNLDCMSSSSSVLSTALGENGDESQLESSFIEAGTKLDIVVNGESGELKWISGESSGMSRWGDDDENELFVHCNNGTSLWVKYCCLVPAFFDANNDST